MKFEKIYDFWEHFGHLSLQNSLNIFTNTYATNLIFLSLILWKNHYLLSKNRLPKNMEKNNGLTKRSSFSVSNMKHFQKVTRSHNHSELKSVRIKPFETNL